MNQQKNTLYHYSKLDIIKALKAVGIKPGDNVFIHSNLGFFGYLKDAKTKFDYYRLFKESLLEVLGEEGTFVVPTYSYSFCWKKEFDKNNTPSVDCGFFSEELRKDPQSKRSNDPNFSVAAIGKNAEYFTDNASPYSYGKNSFWHRFLKKDGKFCNLNIDFLSFIHYVENQLQVPYRFNKGFPGILVENGIKKEKNFYHYCTALNHPNHAPDLTNFIKKANEKKISHKANIGRGQIIVRKATDIVHLITKEFTKDQAFLIKGKSIGSTHEN